LAERCNEVDAGVIGVQRGIANHEVVGFKDPTNE
jgi:hypothetical protein